MLPFKGKYVVCFNLTLIFGDTSMASWLYPANVKFYDVLKAFEEPLVYWPINSNVSIGDTVIIYLSSPHKQIGFSTTVAEINLDARSVTDYTQPYVKNAKNQNATQKSFMKLAVTSRIPLLAESVLSYEHLKLNGLNGPLLGPRKLENNPPLHHYIRQSI